MKTLIAIVTVIAVIVNIPFTNGQERNFRIVFEEPQRFPNFPDFSPKTIQTNATVRIIRGSQNPPFNTIRVEKVQVAKIEETTPGKTQFDVTIKNNATKPIEKFSLYIVAREKGRTIPLAENEIRFEPKAGIEPNETKTVSVSTNPFAQRKWNTLTLEEINKAEIAAELIAITFHREREIKSNTTNAKNANWDDNPIRLQPLSMPNLPNINPPRPQQPQTPARSNPTRPTPPRR